MFEGLVSSLLNKYLGDFIDGVDADHVLTKHSQLACV